MLDDEGYTRKSTRMAAIEAAKRIKKNANANKSLSHDDKKEYQFYEDTIYTPFGVAVTDNGCDNNTQRRRGRKRKMSNQVFDSKAQTMPDLSMKNNKFVEVSPSKCKSMSKRQRGRPPKSQYGKRTFTPTGSIRYKKSKFKHEEEVDDAINLRRESYNLFAKNEPILATVYCNPKELQLVNGGMSYRESLMLFSKDLGPTARKVALRKLLGERENYQARHPCFIDMGSINGLVGNTKTYQVGQPLTSYGTSNTYANYIADYKGKNIVVDDGKNNGNKWNIDNLEMLLSKMKGGVKIGMSTNEIGSFLSKNNENPQQNVDMIIDEKEDIWINASEASRRNGNYNSCVYPSTYAFHPSREVSSSSFFGYDGGPPPFEYFPPVQPLQNWCPPPPEIKNAVVNDGLCLQEELQLAMANYMQMKDQESNDLWQDSLIFGQDFGVGVEMGNNLLPSYPPGI